MSAADEFRQSCGLCMEPYSKRRIPKILPCFHSFCLICLTTLASRSASTTETKCEDSSGQDDKKRSEEKAEKISRPTSSADDNYQNTYDNKKAKNSKKKEGKQEDGSTRTKTEKGHDPSTPTVGDDGRQKIDDTDDNQGDTFLCPTCRTAVIVPKGGVAALQTNFYLDADEKVAEEDSCSKPLCEMCQEGNEQEATHYCNSCLQRMCHSCRRLHDLVKGARDHRVQGIQSAAGVSGRRAGTRDGPGVEGSRWCQYHPDQLLSFQCLQCKASICVHCKLTSHEGHTTEDMATAVTRIKEELFSVLMDANRQLRTLDNCLSRLGQDEADVKHQKADVEKQINIRFDTILAWAKRAREEFLQALEAREEICLKVIQAELNSALDVKETLSGLISRAMATRMTSPGTQWVLAKNELQAALLNDDKLGHYKDPAKRAQLLNQLGCSAVQDAIDLDLMRLYLGQLSQDDGEELVEGGALSFREMVTKVVNMEAEVKALTAICEKARTEEVGFKAVVQNNVAVSVGLPVVFNTVKSNQGEGYASTTGYFTAPVTGTYVFTATLHNTNGNAFSSILYTPRYHHQMISMGVYSTASIPALLQKGERAYVTPQAYITCQAGTSMFSGYLVSAE